MQVEIAEVFESQECIECGISFAITRTMIRHLRETKRAFSCPNGHRQSYLQATETEKKIKGLETRISDLEARLAASAGWLNEKRTENEALMKSNASLRGVITKLKAARK